MRGLVQRSYEFVTYDGDGMSCFGHDVVSRYGHDDK